LPVPRVVAAVTASLQARILAILPDCELCFVQSGSELVRALDAAPCDLMLVEVHYDESAAAAALRCAHTREASFPMICVREVPFAKPAHAALRALRAALGVVATSDFIELSEQPDDAAGNACLRARLSRHLPAISAA
jgi:hypothetical protein